VHGDIVAYDKDEDLALLRLRSETPVAAIAKLYPRGQEKELRVTMPAYAVGAALGEQPVITVGMLCQFGREIDNRDYILNSAAIYFGNSGGALFLADTHELIGVPARIAVVLIGFSADPIPHLGFAIPIWRIYDFLEAQLFRFIYDENFTEKGEQEEREARRQEEERHLARKETVKGPEAKGSTP